MLVSDITKLLPASLEYMVLFNLEKLKHLFDEATIHHMFFLHESTPLDHISHVILTSEGTRLAPQDGPGLIDPEDGSLCTLPEDEPALFDRYQTKFKQFPLDEADCLGVGELAPYFPSGLLFLKIDANIGEASALFSQKPSQTHYELLYAVGVKFLSGENRNGDYLARFTVDLNKHILAGVLSDFSKTGYCNAFFLQHGTIGPTLQAGLTEAASQRIGRARELGIKSAEHLGGLALREPVAMMCQPPPPKQPFPFGDLVPLGLLLRCLNITSRSPKTGVRPELEQHLLNNRQGKLWPFQSGDIATSTDSALILLGIKNPEAVEALEIFSDGNEGYYPQLWSERGDSGKMAAGDFNRHWCQPDIATTYLVRALRRDAGLPELTSTDYLKATSYTRSGLYFANPYLVDWALAMALRFDGSLTAQELRENLLEEILGSLKEDHTFGQYDIPLSTAFAILALAALGYRKRALLLSQLRLSELMDPDGTWPKSTPFYSTFKLPDFPAIFTSQEDEPIDPSDQIVQINGRYFAISYYIDQHKFISTAAATLALSEESSSENDIQNRMLDTHPRYLCQSHAEYIKNFALPPYLSSTDPSKEMPQTARDN
jgi:hypothetical protein